VEVPKCPR